MRVDHAEACRCAPWRVRRAIKLDAAFREEVAGRLEALTEEARPRHWKSRPGTRKAIADSYGPKRRTA